jgi:hypothetical protein
MTDLSGASGQTVDSFRVWIKSSSASMHNDYAGPKLHEVLESYTVDSVGYHGVPNWDDRNTYGDDAWTTSGPLAPTSISANAHTYGLHVHDWCPTESTCDSAWHWNDDNEWFTCGSTSDGVTALQSAIDGDGEIAWVWIGVGGDDDERHSLFTDLAQTKANRPIVVVYWTTGVGGAEYLNRNRHGDTLGFRPYELPGDDTIKTIRHGPLSD